MAKGVASGYAAEIACLVDQTEKKVSFQLSRNENASDSENYFRELSRLAAVRRPHRRD